MSKRSIPDDAVFLIDGSGYIFRAYYGIRPLTSPGGIPSNAVYGFTTMLLKLLREHKPRYLAIAFDTGKQTFRHEMYSAYKANRPPAPEDLVPQFDWIHKVVDAFRIKRLLQLGYEADDLIGTVSRLARDMGKPVVIVTADKDFMQLVTEDVVLLDELRAAKNGTELLIGPKEVVDKFGVPPERVVDVLALAGDSSDNVPGVRGVGEKTAVELVQQYGALENILAHASEIPQNARRERMMSGADMARLSLKLVTIDCHAKLKINLEELENNGPSTTDLRAIFEELGFKKLLNELPALPLPQAGEGDFALAKSGEGYISVTTSEELVSVVHLIKNSSKLAIDTETDSLDPMRANLVGIALCWGPGQAAYIPLGHDMAAAPRQLSLAQVREAIEPLLHDEKRQVIAQNAKYDWHVLVNAGFKPFRVGGDPMLADYLLEADTLRHNLDEMSERYLQHTTIKYEDVCGKGRTQIPFSAVSVEKATEYSAEDADMAYQLANLLESKVFEEGMSSLYHDMELPTLQVLCEMEHCGVKIDQAQLKAMSIEFSAKLLELEKQAYEIAGLEFNLASPKQVSDILFGRLGLESVKKTKTGQSTDADVLEQLALEHPLPKLLLEHRLLSKLKGTYVDALPLLIHPKTGRVHTSFNQAVAATGRLSSSDPNLQNIPIRSPEGRRIREAFIADEGNVLISLDYSQVELRILADLSQDPVMLDSFMQGEDVHRRTASEIFDVSLDEVTPDQRASAKTINFGLLYGMGVRRLSNTLGISRNEASSYLKKYYERYAGIYAWQKTLLEKAKQDGETRTWFGRRRKLPEMQSDNQMLVKRAERVAINTPIQGTAADIMKKAMIDVHHALREQMPQVKMLLQVHDELLIECPSEDAQRAGKLVHDLMCAASPLAVPILVEWAIGRSWADSH